MRASPLRYLSKRGITVKQRAPLLMLSISAFLLSRKGWRPATVFHIHHHSLAERRRFQGRKGIIQFLIETWCGLYIIDDLLLGADKAQISLRKARINSARHYEPEFVSGHGLHGLLLLKIFAGWISSLMMKSPPKKQICHGERDTKQKRLKNI